MEGDLFTNWFEGVVFENDGKRTSFFKLAEIFLKMARFEYGESAIQGLISQIYLDFLKSYETGNKKIRKLCLAYEDDPKDPKVISDSRGYITRAMQNICRKIRRAQNRHVDVNALQDDLACKDSGQGHRAGHNRIEQRACERIYDQERAKWAQEQIDALTESQRQIVGLILRGERSIPEAAKELGLRPEAVKSQYNSAVSRIRKMAKKLVVSAEV